MQDTLTLTKNVADNVGLPAAGVALTTGNGVASIITIISSVIIVLPKVIAIWKDIKNLISKKSSNV